MRTSYVHQKLQTQWVKEENRAKELLEDDKTGNPRKKKCFQRGPSLLLAIIKALWPLLLAAAVMEFIYSFIVLLPPILLDYLITFIGNNEPSWHGYVYAGALFFTACVSTLLFVHNQNFLITASIIPRFGVEAAFYRKVLRLSSNSKSRFTVGEICNMISVDRLWIVELITSWNSLWSCPMRIILVIALLWQYLGIACLAGVFVMILIMPISAKLASTYHKHQKKQMDWKDSRLRQMTEILSGIKVLKLFAWEKPFMNSISALREKEAKTLRKLAFINGSIVFLWICAPFLVAISCFVTYVLIDKKNVLDPSTAFVSLTLFNTLRTNMASIPQLIAQLVQSRVAIRRVTDFLLSDELEEKPVDDDTAICNAVEIDGGTFCWTNGEPPFLRDITLSVPRGSLVAIVGRVGAGKSALFSAILGEMHASDGAVRIMKGGRLAYVSQQAWIQNATIRDNILFVKPMDKSLYDATISRCCLRPDFNMLPGGDYTEVGEKGVNLSGGQKQRISIARAVYQDADIYLLDDPLSAVDSHVGAHIFHHVIGPDGVLQNKTRILATNDLRLLQGVDRIYFLSDGKILESGTYTEMLDQKGEFARLVEENSKKEEESETEEVNEEKSAKTSKEIETVKVSTKELKAQMQQAGVRLSRTISWTLSRTNSMEEPPQKKVKFIENEKMEVGRVKASIFWIYFKYATLYLAFFFILGFTAFKGFEIGSNVWLSQWSSDSPLPDGSQNIQLRNIRIGIYGLLGIGQGLSTLIATIILAIASTRASVRFHNAILWSVMRSPSAFFDTTPMGRILNRFGKDINSVDIDIPNKMQSLTTIIVAIIGSLVVIISTLPIFMVVMIPLSVIYIFIQCFYMSCSRQVRRLQSVTLSPIISFFSESVQGASTIRAFTAQYDFIDRQDKQIDTNCRAFYSSTLLNRWLSIRLQFLGNTVVFVTALLAVIERKSFSPAIVGLILSYALSVTENLATFVRVFTQMESQMIAVERIHEYSDLQSEASWDTECVLFSRDDWPSRGEVIFREYTMRYRSGMDLVLRDINISIPPGQKVGLVGRTGAGKSSLASALFRIVEPESGMILIDGVDIAMLGLHDLRSKITAIPQDPVVFSGTIRRNLDPLKEQSDEVLWKVIEQAHLKNFVLSLEAGLDHQISEGGENLSVGQRQQLCLARALLKKTKVLVLDEATAAVDLETDRLIQKTIRQEFWDCTVFTIAHRLYTVLDYDRILVMDKGSIVEDGSPDELLENTNSLLYELGLAAGLLQ